MEILFVWLARLLFLGIFFIAGGMLHRAWKIAVRKDMRHVADWRGRAVANGEQWAAWVLSINLIAAGGLLAIGLSVVVTGLEFAVERAVHRAGVGHGARGEALVGQVALEQLAQADVVVHDEDFLGHGIAC